MKTLVAFLLCCLSAYAGSVSIPSGVYDWEIWYNGVLQSNKAGTGPNGSGVEYGSWSGLHVVKIYAYAGGLVYSTTSPCASLGSATTSNWYVTFTGSSDPNNIGNTWSRGCGDPPSTAPTITNYGLTNSYTNLTFSVQKVSLAVHYLSNRADLAISRSVEPGGVTTFVVTDTNAFTYVITAPGPDTDGYNESLQFGSGSASSSTSTNANSNTASLGVPVDGDVFAGGPAAPSAFNPTIGTTNITRATNYTSDVLALATLDANQQARQQEMVSVMLNLEKEKWKRDAAVTIAQGEAAARLQAAVSGVGTKVEAVGTKVDSLSTALTTGGSGTIAQKTMGTAIYSAAGTLASGLGPSLPSVTTDNSAFTIPLASLGVAGLSDQSWAFNTGNLGTVRSTVRTVLLGLVTLGFLVATYRLIGRVAGV